MFHRSYDISCIKDGGERLAVENAINGANAACSSSVDAWQYIQLGYLTNDLRRTLGSHDDIPNTIFNVMSQDNHSGLSMGHVVNTLQQIAQDYEGWRLLREHDNSRQEGSTNFWNTWRTMRLIPYYSSMSGGGSRASIGPILENFLYIKSARNEGPSEERDKLEFELMNHLGSDLESKIYVLNEIISMEPSPYCENLLQSFKKIHGQQKAIEQSNDLRVKESLQILSDAIDSKNPTALRAALNPGWYSVNFHTSDLYKKGSEFLAKLI